MASCEMARNMYARARLAFSASGASRDAILVRMNGNGGAVDVEIVKARSVKRSTRRPTGARSGSYVSSSAGSARPPVTRPSFHPRFTASWMPVFMPWAPAGLWMCAASPARNTRPARYRVAPLL
jgi:hypothetical protein